MLRASHQDHHILRLVQAKDNAAYNLLRSLFTLPRRLLERVHLPRVDKYPVSDLPGIQVTGNR